MAMTRPVRDDSSTAIRSWGGWSAEGRTDRAHMDVVGPGSHRGRTRFGSLARGDRSARNHRGGSWGLGVGGTVIGGTADAKTGV